MRPRLFTLRNFLLLAVAGAIFGGMAYWVSKGMPVPGARIPSTAGKIAFVSDRSGHKDLWMMDGATGQNAVALTNDEPEDRQPAWSASGDRLTFISTRKNGTPQVFLMNAQAGDPVRQITITSGAKDNPRFGPEGVIYYLDSGKLNATEPGTSDANAIFPTADQRVMLAQVLSTGGLDPALPSPDGSRVAAALRLERGRALLLLNEKNQDEHHDDELLIIARSSGQMFLSFLPDNSLAAAFEGGGPTPQPGVILNEQLTENPQYSPPPIPPPPESALNSIVLFGPDGVPRFAIGMPFIPGGFAVSRDGKRAVVTVEQGDAPGVYLVPTSEDGEGKRLFEQSAREPVFSPDGGTVAFVSGKDIFTVALDGSGEAKNLTQGKGSNSAPVWSPAPPKKP